MSDCPKLDFEWLRDEFAKAMPTPEDMANLTNSILEVRKLGVSLPFSWEALYGDRGHEEPVGIAWLQWLGWLWHRGLYALYVRLERTLDRSRHFAGAYGYDFEPSEFRSFRQRTRWVNDE